MVEEGENNVNKVPLYIRIALALALGVIAGVILPNGWPEYFDIPARLILRVLGAIAPPLILVAVLQALIGAKAGEKLAGKMFFLLVLNTTVAIGIGIAVANSIQPGSHASLAAGDAPKVTGDPLTQLLDNIPSSLLRPLVDGNVIGVIFVAVAFGIAARSLQPAKQRQVLEALDIGFDLILKVLHWVIALVPLAVFSKVAFVVGTQGFKPFVALGWFIVSVIFALALQAAYYLVRIRFASWVRPLSLLRGTRDALAMAFSTASSTATMPVTYSCLREKVGLREEPASLGGLLSAAISTMTVLPCMKQWLPCSSLK